MQTATRSSIEQFVDRYYLPVFRFATRLCDDPSHALTLTDRTFRAAVERSRDLPVPANVRTWLCSILLCKFLEARQRSQSAWIGTPV
jgi:DNA-directed RNA polymerase specialized sigma24 family protein